MIESDFTAGFFAGYNGQECPDDASDEFKDAYGRGYQVSEIESHRAELRENKK